MVTTELRFGLSVTPSASGLAEMLAHTTLADELGLDFAALQHHPYQPDHLDMWSTLAFLAARTSRIRFLPDVADLGLRPPAMLAKAAASVDVLSGGRVELGVGSGGFPDAIASMGGARRTPAESVAATAEAMVIMRAALDAGPVRLSGDYHHVEGYQAGPVTPHRVGIWVGAQKPRMLRLIGRLADGWVSPLNLYVPPASVNGLQAVIDEGAVSAGRDPGQIRRMYNVLGGITPAGTTGTHTNHGLVGPVEFWAETLSAWARDLRFDTFVFWPRNPSPAQIRLFAEEVVPAVRVSWSART